MAFVFATFFKVFESFFAIVFEGTDDATVFFFDALALGVEFDCVEFAGSEDKAVALCTIAVEGFAKADTVLEDPDAVLFDVVVCIAVDVAVVDADVFEESLAEVPGVGAALATKGTVKAKPDTNAALAILKFFLLFFLLIVSFQFPAIIENDINIIFNKNLSLNNIYERKPVNYSENELQIIAWEHLLK